jgi:hypothetical protein
MAALNTGNVSAVFVHGINGGVPGAPRAKPGVLEDVTVTVDLRYEKISLAERVSLRLPHRNPLVVSTDMDWIVIF